VCVCVPVHECATYNDGVGVIERVCVRDGVKVRGGGLGECERGRL